MPPTTNHSPRVSIIVRTRRRPTLLRRALDDIFEQTFEDLEIIVVDDSEPGGEAALVIDGLPARQRQRIVLISRAGLDHGRWLSGNAGVERARGEYLVLHDDDDLWHPRFLATTVRLLDEDPEAGGACVRTEIFIERPARDGGLETTDRYPFLPDLAGITLTEMMRANRIVPISFLYRRTLHEQLGLYDQSLSVLGDWEFYLRVLTWHPIRLIDEVLASWSHRPEDFSESAGSISDEGRRVTTDAAIRDDIVRAGAQASGIASFLHVATEARRIEGRIDAAHAALLAEGSAIEARLSKRMDTIEKSLTLLADTMHERTSFTRRLREFRRSGRREAGVERGE